jgi:hypothetical protein
VGIGAAFSTTLGGYAMDHFGRTLAFSSLATIAACGLALLWLLPETRRVVGALASAAQTAPSLKSERKRSRLSANWDARADSARSISNPTIATTQLLISSDRSSPELTAGADHLPWLPLSKAARNDSLSSVRAYGPLRPLRRAPAIARHADTSGILGVGHPRVFGVRYIFGWGLIKVGGGGLAMGGGGWPGPRAT